MKERSALNTINEREKKWGQADCSAKTITGFSS
jgi:hypothetical protein